MNPCMKPFWNRIDKDLAWIAVAASCVAIITASSILFHGRATEAAFASSVAIAVCALLSRIRDQRIAAILALAFLARLALALVQRFVFALPDTGGDAVYFDALAQQVARSFVDGSHPLQGYGIAHRYSAFVGFWYALFGYGPLIPQLVNVLFGVTTVWAVSEIAWELSASERTSRAAALVAALFPTMNLYSAILLREYIMVVSVSVSLVLFVRWISRGRERDAYGSIVLAFIAPLFHIGMLFLPAAYVLFLVFYSPKDQRFRLVPNARIALVLLFVALAFFPTAPRSDQGDMSGPDAALGAPAVTVMGPDSSEPSSVATVNEHLDAYTDRGRAVYLENLRPASRWEMVFQTPVRMIHFLFSPFPWQISSLQDMFGAIDALLYVTLTGFGLWGLWIVGRDRPALAIAILVVACFFLVTFSWGVSNYGAAIRHREKLAFLFVTVGTVGMMSIFSRASLDTTKV